MAATPRCHTNDEDGDKKVHPTKNQYVFTLRDMSTTSQKCCCSVMVIYQISNAMYILMPTLCFLSAVFYYPFSDISLGQHVTVHRKIMMSKH
jgi:hypothetical protein